MEIIIEYTLIDNLVIDFLILYLSCKILKHKVVFWELALSSCVGTACALVMPIINLPTYAMVFFKLTLGAIMVLISLPCNNFKKAFISFMGFILMTAGMGGICFFLLFMISGDISINLLTTYSSQIPVGVILLVCSLTFYFVNKLIKLIYKKRMLNTFIYETTFLNDGKEIKIDAYLDSGNTLIDPITNKPVVIINFTLFNKLYNLPLEKVLMKNVGDKEIKNCHYITFNTVGKKSDMLVFEIEKMKIFFCEKREQTI